MRVPLQNPQHIVPGEEVQNFIRISDTKAVVRRRHRQLPIKATYIGKNIPTSREEIVHVYREEEGEEDRVVLRKNASGGAR